MALVLFGAPVGTNVLIRLDDPALATDEGAAMPEPFYRTAAVDFGPAGGQGRLRRIVQAVTSALLTDPSLKGTVQMLGDFDVTFDAYEKVDDSILQSATVRGVGLTTVSGG